MYKNINLLQFSAKFPVNINDLGGSNLSIFSLLRLLTPCNIFKTRWWLRFGHTERQVAGTCRRDMLQGHVAGSNIIVCHRSKPCRGDKKLSPRHVAGIKSVAATCCIV